MFSYKFFFTELKNNYLRNSLKFPIKLTKKYLNLCIFLKKNNLISNYFIEEEKNNLIIFLNYFNNFAVMDNFIVYSQNTKYKLNHYCILNLKKQFLAGQFACVSTSKGLLTVRECLLYNISGKVIFSFFN